jgi:crossover junction endodeoxyribonuclease RusA
MSNDAIVFTVIGVPQPQGSARAFTYHRKPEKGGGIGARVDSDNQKLKAWRRDVALAARRVYRGDPIVGPVRVVAEFYLPRPKSLRGDRSHVTRPDCDKLLRGICDAVTDVLIEDDSQVTQVKGTKAYAAIGRPPCAVIAVTPLTEEGRLL